MLKRKINNQVLVPPNMILKNKFILSLSHLLVCLSVFSHCRAQLTLSACKEEKRLVWAQGFTVNQIHGQLASLLFLGLQSSNISHWEQVFKTACHVAIRERTEGRGEETLLTSEGSFGFQNWGEVLVLSSEIRTRTQLNMQCQNIPRQQILQNAEC